MKATQKRLPLRKERKLTRQQHAVLRMLYAVRYASIEQLARNESGTAKTTMIARMNVLLKRGLVMRHYDSSYRIIGKPARYFLAPGVIPLLTQSDSISESGVKGIYKNPTLVSESIDAYTGIFEVTLQLRRLYGLSAVLYRNELSGYDVPRYVPGAVVRFTKSGRLYFIDYITRTMPIFTVLRKIKSYLDWLDENNLDSDESRCPRALLICETDTVVGMLHRKVRQLNNSGDTQMIIGVSSLGVLKGATSKSDPLWRDCMTKHLRQSLLHLGNDGYDE